MLEWQTIPILFGGGMVQGIDPRLAPMGQALELKNVYFRQAGGLTKRRGFDYLPLIGLPDLALIRGLFSTGPELCAVTERELYAFVPELGERGEWRARGSLSPFGIKSHQLSGGRRTYQSVDVSARDGHILFGAAGIGVDGSTGATTTSYGCIGVVLTETDRRTVCRGDIVITEPLSVRAFSCRDNLLLAIASDASGPSTLSVYNYNILTGTALALLSTPTTNLFILDGAGDGTEYWTRTYDACAVRDHDYCIAWIDETSRDVIARRYNSAAAQQATVTIAGTFNRLAICDSPTLTFVYLLTYDTATRLLQIRGLGRSTMAVAWGPVTVRTLSIGDTINDLGMEAGIVYDVERVVSTWTYDATGAALPCVERGVANGTDGSAYLAVNNWSFNCSARSRPFIVDGYPYGTRIDRFGFPYSTLCMHGIAPTASPASDASARLSHAATWSVGVAASIEQGSANAVATLSDGSRIMATLTTIDYHDPGAPFVANYLRSGNIVDIEVSPPVRAVSTAPGSAILSGGMWSWYDGALCDTFSYALPPMPVTATLAADSGVYTALNGTFQYRATWQRVDALGIVHRSDVSTEIAASPVNQDVLVKWATLQAVNEFASANESNVIVYRSASTGLFEQVTLPSMTVLNSYTVELTPFTDGGYPLAGSLYTEAELPSICPEGGSFPLLTTDRLLFLGMASRERFQWTKPIRPFTPGEQVFAPETCEGFGAIVPGEIMCGATLDERTVILCRQGIYLVTGQGPDNTGAGGAYGLASVSSDFGCIAADSVVAFRDGIMFQSEAGIHLLTRGLEIQPVGFDVLDLVERYSTITSAVAFPRDFQVRFTCNNPKDGAGIVLVYDYDAKAWSYWVVCDGLALTRACLHQGTYYVTDGSAVLQQSNEHCLDGQQWVTARVALPWFQGPSRVGDAGAKHGMWQRVRRAVPTARVKSPCRLVMKAGVDFTLDEAYYQVQSFASEDLPPRFRLARQKSSALQLIVEDAPPAEGGYGTGEGFVLTGITIEAATKPGARRGKAV